MQILVIEDEPAIADFLQRGLEAEGYIVHCTGDGVEGEALAKTNDVDLVILDRMLPDRDGVDVLSGIRVSKPRLPVVLLTARDQIEDKVEGLNAGATDYVTKPFSFDELVARVRAHLRLPDQVETTLLQAGDVSVRLLERRVNGPAGEANLSAKEFDLLVYLMRHKNQVVSRQQILNAVWGYNFDPRSNVVEVYIGYVRRKLSSAGSEVPIDTVRSVGYRLSTRE